MKNSLLVHKHLIIRAEAIRPPVDEEQLQNWLIEFIESIKDSSVLDESYTVAWNYIDKALADISQHTYYKRFRQMFIWMRKNKEATPDNRAAWNAIVEKAYAQNPRTFQDPK